MEPSHVDLKALEPYLEDLAQTSADTGRSLARLGQLLVVLDMLAPAFAFPKPGQSLPTTHPAVIAATEELDAAPENAWTLADLAERVHVSQSYLCRLFMRELGISPLHYLERRRLELTAQLLLEGDLSINEIGAVAGCDGSQLHDEAVPRCARNVPQSLPVRFPTRFDRGCDGASAGIDHRVRCTMWLATRLYVSSGNCVSRGSSRPARCPSLSTAPQLGHTRCAQQAGSPASPVSSAGMPTGRPATKSLGRISPSAPSAAELSERDGMEAKPTACFVDVPGTSSGPQTKGSVICLGASWKVVVFSARKDVRRSR